MLAVYLSVFFLVGVASGAPEGYVRMMEIVAAQTVSRHQENTEDVVLSYKPYGTTWEAFKLKHGKSYESHEEAHRYGVFLMNVAYIESHNRLYRSGKKSFYLGLNHFADYEFEEYRKLNGYRGNNVSVATGSHFLPSSFVTLPDSVDWRQHGYVTGVKNQGSCGSCWSFSATGSLEGQHYKKKGKLASLSEQQLVDCSAAYGNHGCSGGLMDNAFNYIKATHGIDSEKSYPYLAEQETKCKFNRENIAALCTGFVDIPDGSETDLKHAAATVGPISVAIDASHRSFQFYHSGVYDEPQCSATQLDHGVLVVGYGVSHGQDYWIVKNSWGPTWGNQGYVWMSRNKQNQCGIASKASYPLV